MYLYFTHHCLPSAICFLLTWQLGADLARAVRLALSPLEADKLLELGSSSVGVETDYGLDGQGSISHSVQTGSGDHKVSYPMGTTGPFLRIELQGSEADHSHPSNAELKNVGAMPPLLHRFSWRET
jgi:hypothetical protein